MRVLLINHFPLEGSGSGTYTRDVAAYLLKKGHAVCAVFPENLEPDRPTGLQCLPVFFNGCRADALPFNFPCFTTHPRSAMTFADLSQEQLRAYLASFDQAIGQAIESFKPDIIHSQHIWLLSYLAAKRNVPNIITAHGTDLMGCQKWPQFKPFADQAAAGANRIITISKNNHEATLAAFPQIAAKTKLLSNGYNNDIFYPQPVDRPTLLASYGVPYAGEKTVLFAGKLTGFKGVDVLLRAAALYEGSGAPASAGAGAEPESEPGSRPPAASAPAAPAARAIVTVIAGSGDEDANLRQLAQDLGLRSTYFIGHRSQAELRALYSASDVFVVPSRNEPFGLVALEAMACGLPVVATNQGGLVDFVTNEVGTLADCGPEAIAAAIIKELGVITSSPEHRSEVAQYALGHYSMTHYIDELEAVYRDVLSNR